jgi:hypothetical protein
MQDDVARAGPVATHQARLLVFDRDRVAGAGFNVGGKPLCHGVVEVLARAGHAAPEVEKEEVQVGRASGDAAADVAGGQQGGGGRR